MQNERHKPAVTRSGAIAYVARSRLKPTENLDAWDRYQRGLWHVWRFNKTDNAEARRFFQSAVDDDPGFSSAYAGLAYSYIQGFAVGLLDPEDQPLKIAAKEARKAVALDNRNAFASWALGGFHLFSRDFASAIDELKKTVELNPSFAPAHLWIGTAMLAEDQPQDAKISMDAALRLSPRDPMAGLMLAVRAFAHLMMDEYEDAEDWGRKAIGASNAHQAAYSVRAAALGYLNRPKEARATIEAMRQAIPERDLDQLARVVPFFANQDLMAKYVEGLRKAGVPE